MKRIRNDIFTEREKSFLEFVLQFDFPERERITEQLNLLKAEDIVRDITPYYWIMEFRPACVRPGYDCMCPVVDFQVLYEGGAAPTVFDLCTRDGHVFELQIYNADSSKMDLDQIMNGRVLRD